MAICLDRTSLAFCYFRWGNVQIKLWRTWFTRQLLCVLLPDYTLSSSDFEDRRIVQERDVVSKSVQILEGYGNVSSRVRLDSDQQRAEREHSILCYAVTTNDD